MTRARRTYRRRRGCRGDRDRGQREPGCVLLPIVGMGCARVPRPDDGAPDPRPRDRAREAADRLRKPHGRARRVDRAVLALVDQRAGVDAGGRADARVRGRRAGRGARPAARRRPRRSRRSAHRHRARVVVRPRHASVPRSVRHVRRSDHLEPARRATRILECARASRDDGAHRRNRVRCTRSTHERGARFGCRHPGSRADALLHVLARRMGLRSPLALWRQQPAILAGSDFSGRRSSSPSRQSSASGMRTQQDVLTTEDAPNAAAAAAAREGHRVAVALCVAICVSALVAAGARAFAERARVSPRSRRVFDVALVGSRRRDSRRRGGRSRRAFWAQGALRLGAGRRSRSERPALQHLRQRARRNVRGRLDGMARAPDSSDTARARSSTSGTRTDRARWSCAMHTRCISRP